jgi:hypothetical protein
MRILATSDEICLEEIHPYETRHLTYILRLSSMYRTANAPSPGPTKSFMAVRRKLAPVLKRLTRRKRVARGLAITEPPRVGQWLPPPPKEGELLPAVGGEPYWKRLFDANWSLLSEALPEGAKEKGWAGVSGDVTYWTEKAPTWVDDDIEGLIDVKRIYLMRDPRDMWLSILAMDEKRGYYGFGRNPGEREEPYLERYLDTVADFAARVAPRRSDTESLVMRYEDLVTDQDREVERLSSFLDVGFESEPEDLRFNRPHATTHDASASVSRWRTEMEPDRVGHFAERLGDVLDAFGYDS